MKIKLFVTGVMAGVIGLVTVPLVALASPSGPPSNVIVVKGDTAAGENQPGWLFNRDTTTSTPFEFNTDQHSIGQGSLYVKPIGANPSDKFIAENFLRTPVADVSSIAYDFLIAGTGTPASADQFYLNVYTTINDSTFFYDCRYDYVPTTGSTTTFTTAVFNATDTPTNVVRRAAPQAGTPNPCPTTLAGMPAGSHIRAFSVSVGDTSASDTGLAGYLDKVVVTKTSGTTTYDFEPTIGPPTNKDQCKDDGWKIFNTPSFKNQWQCKAYVAKHADKVSGNVKYTAFGLNRQAEFNLNSAANHIGVFRYWDANGGKYKVRVSEIKVSGNTAWFAGVVETASNPSWVGQWLFAKVEDNAPDKVSGDFMSEAAAKAGVNAMSSPASGPFNVTKGNLKVSDN